VYQRNIERVVGGIEQLEDEIAAQIEEEIDYAATQSVHVSPPVAVAATKTPSRVK
jgi:hypothetical protein